MEVCPISDSDNIQILQIHYVTLLVNQVGSEAVARTMGVSHNTLYNFMGGNPGRKIQQYLTEQFGDDPDALRRAAAQLASEQAPSGEGRRRRRPGPSLAAPVAQPPRPFAPRIFIGDADMTPDAPQTLTEAPHPNEHRLPATVLALVAKWRHLVRQDVVSNVDKQDKKTRIAALSIREQRLEVEIQLIIKHGLTLAGSPDVYWDELRRHEESSWRKRELNDVRKRLRKLKRFSEVFSWLRSPFSSG